MSGKKKKGLTTLPSCPVSMRNNRELMEELERIRKQEEAETEAVESQEETEPDVHGDISGVIERVGRDIKKTSENK
ncbi:hypothetical protein GF340_01395 [Candidatus Peregrinibacteria bacterium]|nr:hypothetical protein [Candidatus Peregrinibacteria bacterium]